MVSITNRVFIPPLFADYELLDSGGLERLERFGRYTLRRPSSLAIWRPRLSDKIWNKADLVLRDKADWNRTDLNDWQLDFNGIKLQLRTQRNGQIGFFPEHLNLLPIIEQFIKPEDQVLNLYAFTGLASTAALKRGAKVCHVDISKQALGWARENMILSDVNTEAVRFIPEDALTFLKREARRQKQYQCIIADPPSFSRISNSSSWDLEEQIHPLLEAIKDVLDPKRFMLCLSTHHLAMRPTTLANLILDLFPQYHGQIEAKGLCLKESASAQPERLLECGAMLKLLVE